MSAPFSVPPGLRALKVLVVVMALLILAGVAVIGVTIANRLSGAASTTTPPATPALADAAIGNRTITLPPGARIVETVLSDTRLLLRTDGPDGPQMHLFHLPSGRSLGSFRIDSTPNSHP